MQAGNEEEIEKYSKRTVRVTREHNEECKRLLRLMGEAVQRAQRGMCACRFNGSACVRCAHPV